MLNASDAAQQLESYRVKGTLLGRVEKGRHLPQPLRAILLEALAAKGPYQRSEVLDQHSGALQKVCLELSERDLRRLVETLLPKLVDATLAAWHAFGRRPYQTDASRKPFRCPHQTAPITLARSRWLMQLAIELGDFEQDVEWVATWAAHFGPYLYGRMLGQLLAGALDVPGLQSDKVLEILRRSIASEHPIAQMGIHVVVALQSSGREDAWEVGEKLLLAAERQEGLRQVILESIDESHPEAFVRMLRVILEQDLGRFSSAMRAFDVWFGFGWDGSSKLKLDAVLEIVLSCFDNASRRVDLLRSDDPEQVYLALWTLAFEDIDRAIPSAVEILEHAKPEHRFVATHLLAQLGWSAAIPHLLRMLDDPDLRVAARAFKGCAFDISDCLKEPESQDRLKKLWSRLRGTIGAAAKADPKTTAFDVFERFLARVTEPKVRLAKIVWPWFEQVVVRTEVASVAFLNAEGVPRERLLAHVSDLDAGGRERFVRKLGGGASTDSFGYRVGAEPEVTREQPEDVRRILVSFLGDPSASVRGVAFAMLQYTQVEPDESDELVRLLARTAGDLRQRAIARLLDLGDPEVLGVSDRLLEDENPQRRFAGLELLRNLVESNRSCAAAKQRATAYASNNAALSEIENAHLAAIRGEHSQLNDVASVFGLIDETLLPKWPLARPMDSRRNTPAAIACIDAVLEMVKDRREEEVELEDGSRAMFFDALRRLHWAKHRPSQSANSQLPWLEPFRAWSERRDSSCRDPDGLELIRARLWWTVEKANASAKFSKLLRSISEFSAEWVIRELFSRIATWSLDRRAFDFVLDEIEAAFHGFGETEFGQLEKTRERSRWQFTEECAAETKLKAAERLIAVYRELAAARSDVVTPQHQARMFVLLAAYRDRTYETMSEFDPTLSEFLAWFECEADARIGASVFLDLLAGPFSSHRTTSSAHLQTVSRRNPPAEIARFPALVAEIERLRSRLVELECRRGEGESCATDVVAALAISGGLESAILALEALGKVSLVRSTSVSHYWGSDRAAISRAESLSHIVRNSAPRADESPEVFVRRAKATKITTRRWIEFACFAPQWAKHVEALLGWREFESAVWWLHAHTKDERYGMSEFRDDFAASVSERTPLSANDLREGAVDVRWFQDISPQFDDKRWAELFRAAKFASTAGGHTRAQLFASAMRGEVEISALFERGTTKRHQDSVRAIGLVPLAPGDRRQADLLARYRWLCEFRRESRKFGSMRKQSEGRAVSIALENLARTAGFRDPMRLAWAMEIESVKDLLDGPIVVAHEPYEVRLSVDTDGEAHLVATKAGKPLSALPAALKKLPEVATLKERLGELERQHSEGKRSLEEAMCCGDRFEVQELGSLLAHPVLAPLLSKLVFISEGAPQSVGYLSDFALSLIAADGSESKLSRDQRLRIAHPHDLFSRGDWSAWQRECYRRERVQPFKQVFREVYPLTETERAARTASGRYAGHQVEPRKALALLGTRNWVVKPEEGVSRTFHEDGLTARLCFEETFYSPADVEGLTLENVIFTAKGEFTPLDLASIPPRLFSETMRDLDLVVSVAHQGGADPEATASTIEMRANLVRETCALLSLTNVSVKSNHVVIRGERAEYSVHLGSAIARTLLGATLAIVAVHSQHRGRIFLPFADDDPRTAECLSKVLLLSRDRDIQDPKLLEQIRAATRGA